MATRPAQADRRLPLPTPGQGRPARVAGRRWPPTSATASAAARASASRGSPTTRTQAASTADGSRPRPRGRQARRLAARRGDRDRAARRDAPDRRADRPWQTPTIRPPRSFRWAKRPAPPRRPVLATATATNPAGEPGGGADDERVAGGHERLHDPAQHGGEDATRRLSRSTRRKQMAVAGGAADAAVLDSDLYPSLPPGNYVIYSGVYDRPQGRRRSARRLKRASRRAGRQAAVVERGGRLAPTGGHRARVRTGAAAQLRRHRLPGAEWRQRSDPGESTSCAILQDPSAAAGAAQGSEPTAPRSRRPRRAAPDRPGLRPRPRPQGSRHRPGGRRAAPQPPAPAAPLRPPARGHRPAARDAQARWPRGEREPRAKQAATAASGPPRPGRRADRRRDELARRFAELQSDLGGLAYEMAIRDHFRLDVLRPPSGRTAGAWTRARGRRAGRSGRPPRRRPELPGVRARQVPGAATRAAAARSPLRRPRPRRSGLDRRPRRNPGAQPGRPAASPSRPPPRQPPPPTPASAPGRAGRHPGRAAASPTGRHQVDQAPQAEPAATQAEPRRGVATNLPPGRPAPAGQRSVRVAGRRGRDEASREADPRPGAPRPRLGRCASPRCAGRRCRSSTAAGRRRCRRSRSASASSSASRSAPAPRGASGRRSR